MENFFVTVADFVIRKHVFRNTAIGTKNTEAAFANSTLRISTQLSFWVNQPQNFQTKQYNSKSNLIWRPVSTQNYQTC